jgi:hypothetical protein
MNKFKSHIWLAAGLLALMAVVAGFSAKPMLAAIKAALVKDVDQPARNFVSFELSPNQSYAVPAGKILVIEWVSATGIPAGNLYQLRFSGDTGTASNTHRWTANFLPGTSAFYQQVRLYAQDGQTISMNSTVAGSPQLFMQGYLLDQN